METLLIIIGIIAWLISGYKSFVYWWTSEFDFTNEDIFPALCTSIFGPFSYILGYFIHMERPRKIIKKKR